MAIPGGSTDSSCIQMGTGRATQLAEHCSFKCKHLYNTTHPQGRNMYEEKYELPERLCVLVCGHGQESLQTKMSLIFVFVRQTLTAVLNLVAKRPNAGGLIGNMAPFSLIHYSSRPCLCGHIFPAGAFLSLCGMFGYCGTIKSPV